MRTTRSDLDRVQRIAVERGTHRGVSDELARGSKRWHPLASRRRYGKKKSSLWVYVSPSISQLTTNCGPLSRIKWEIYFYKKVFCTCTGIIETTKSIYNTTLQRCNRCILQRPPPRWLGNCLYSWEILSFVSNSFFLLFTLFTCLHFVCWSCKRIKGERKKTNILFDSNFILGFTAVLWRGMFSWISRNSRVSPRQSVIESSLAISSSRVRRVSCYLLLLAGDVARC